MVDAELRYLQSGYANNYAITDETTALIGRAEEIETTFFEPVDILSFSMPCSGFSRAGKAKHGQNPEAHTGAAALFGTMNAIRAANPAVLISENVVEAQYSPAYVLLKAELIRLGYEVFERIMDASDTGSIENRKRYWFIALSKGLAPGFTFDMIHSGASARQQQIAEILESDIPESAWSENNYLKDKAQRDAADGKGVQTPAAHRPGGQLRHHRTTLHQAALDRAVPHPCRRQGADLHSTRACPSEVGS